MFGQEAQADCRLLRLTQALGSRNVTPGECLLASGQPGAASKGGTEPKTQDFGKSANFVQGHTAA